MAEQDKKTTGGCVCGALRYEFTGKPATKGICHCLLCRHHTGSAFTTNLIVPAAHYTQHGSARTYMATQESGLHVTFTFCETCGTTVQKTGDGQFKGVVIVQAGTLDGEGALEEARPDAELWVKRRVGWLNDVRGAGQVPEFM